MKPVEWSDADKARERLAYTANLFGAPAWAELGWQLVDQFRGLQLVTNAIYDEPRWP